MGKPAASCQEEKRRMIRNLLNAGKSTSEIRSALCVSRTAIFRVRHMLRETGDVLRRHGSGTTRTKRTPALSKAVKAKIQRNPRRSIRKLAAEHNVSGRTMERLIKDDLQMSSRAVVSKQFLSEKQKQERLRRCRQILNWKKSHPGHVFIFSDEKTFTVDETVNRRNTRYISSVDNANVDSGVRISPKTKHPAGVMVLGLVASDGQKCPLIFVPDGGRVDSALYQRMLQEQVLPWLEKSFPNGNYVFQQDGAPAHTSVSTQQFLQSHVAAFWDKKMWPPSSPDLNPLDFSIWARLDAEACKARQPNLTALKAAVTRAWGRLSPSYIQSVCASFRGRVERCIAANGDYFE